MNAELLSPNDPRWLQFLDRVRYDGYHLPEYARVAAQHVRGEAVAFYAEDGDEGVLMPLIVRDLPPSLGAPPEWRDAKSPYGYSGPITTPGIQLDTLRCALRKFRKLARQREIVTAFIRLHPLQPVETSVLGEFGTVVNHGDIVYVDLSKHLDELWADTRLNHRRDIARLAKLGYRVDLDDWTAYAAFREIYRMTMQRRSAKPYYFFSDAYFDELRERLADHLHLCVVRGPRGDVAAGGLFIVADGIAEYHLGGTADGCLAHAPSKLMFDFARRWAKGLGMSILNLGGGQGGIAGSLRRFKSGFSRARADLYTARLVFDDARYTWLTSVSRGLGPVDDAPTAFFPAYRQPYDGGII